MRKPTVMNPRTSIPANDVTDLVLAAQRGDRVAMGRLFERFERHVLAVAVRCVGDYAEAQELAQDVFLQAMRKLPQLRDPQALPGWLRKMTRRMAINRRKRLVPRTAAEAGSVEQYPVETRTPLAEMLSREQVRRVRQGLTELKELDRQTLVAFYLEDRSLAEMSAQFDAPIGTIKRRLHVARKRLARQLEPAAAV